VESDESAARLNSAVTPPTSAFTIPYSKKVRRDLRATGATNVTRKDCPWTWAGSRNYRASADLCEVPLRKSPDAKIAILFQTTTRQGLVKGLKDGLGPRPPL